MSKDKNRPSYFKFLLKEHKSSAILSLIGIGACIGVTPTLIESYYDGAALFAIIGAFVALYGFTAGMLLNPWTIYVRLKKMNYWADDSPYRKDA